jgi:hypothetical protein
MPGHSTVAIEDMTLSRNRPSSLTYASIASARGRP